MICLAKLSWQWLRLNILTPLSSLLFARCFNVIYKINWPRCSSSYIGFQIHTYNTYYIIQYGCVSWERHRPNFLKNEKLKKLKQLEKIGKIEKNIMVEYNKAINHREKKFFFRHYLWSAGRRFVSMYVFFVCMYLQL